MTGFDFDRLGVAERLGRAMPPRTRYHPLRGKRPACPGTGEDGWKRCDHLEHQCWNRPGVTGYGIALRDLTVIDFDSRKLFLDLRGLVDGLGHTMAVKTPRGYHLYLRGEVDRSFSLGGQFDVKTGPGHYVVGPWSKNRYGERYTLTDGRRDNTGAAHWPLPLLPVDDPAAVELAWRYSTVSPGRRRTAGTGNSPYGCSSQVAAAGG